MHKRGIVGRRRIRCANLLHIIYIAEMSIALERRLKNDPKIIKRELGKIKEAFEKLETELGKEAIEIYVDSKNLRHWFKGLKEKL